MDMRFSLAVSLFFKVCFTVLKSHNLNKPFSHRLVKIDLKIYYILELLLLYKNLVRNEKNSHTRELNHYPWLNVNCLIVFSTMWT